ncbi:MAG: hypothetical protein M5T52_08840 [Ignavibacteriaceae bacterium]|nr:hypothetical protein [Ignavibacteriaceae bacterium]MEB2297391.1 hypothetical protein [Ignavibacteria bacterium]
MKRTYQQIKKKEKILNITYSTIFFLVGFAIMIAIMSFITSI